MFIENGNLKFLKRPQRGRMFIARMFVLHSGLWLLRNSKGLSIRKPLAQIVTESPEAKSLVFPAQKERPTEAPFWAWKNKLFAEDLQWIAGNSS